MKLYPAVAAFLVIASACHAQQAGIMGRWTMDPTRSESAAQQDPAGYTELSISQTAAQLSIRTRQGRAERTVSYNLDGTDTVSQLGTDNATGHMQWNGGQLVTDTTYNVRETALGQTATYSLSSDGREMTVEYKLRVLHGYEGNHEDAAKKDPNYSIGKDTFTRP